MVTLSNKPVYLPFRGEQRRPVVFWIDDLDRVGCAPRGQTDVVLHSRGRSLRPQSTGLLLVEQGT